MLLPILQGTVSKPSRHSAPTIKVMWLRSPGLVSGVILFTRLRFIFHPAARLRFLKHTHSDVTLLLKTFNGSKKSRILSFKILQNSSSLRCHVLPSCHTIIPHFLHPFSQAIASNFHALISSLILAPATVCQNPAPLPA